MPPSVLRALGGDTTHVLTPDRKPTTDRSSTDTTRVHTGEPVHPVEVIHRSRNDPKTAASPKPRRHGDSSQGWGPAGSS